VNELSGDAKRRIEEAIVDILSFSSGRPSPRTLNEYSSRDWERGLAWMDDMGLALYFLKAIEETEDVVPDFVIQSLQRKRRANEERTAYMQRQFECIGRRFENAGIRYAAVKGLTLVPDYCPDASQRHQSDFDYLTDHEGLYTSSRLLEEMGYVLDQETDRERVFVYPCQQKPERGDTQYGASAPHSVEMHLTIGHFNLAWKEPPFLENVAVRRFQGSTFHSLCDVDSFVLQAVHAFHHLLEGWIKLSWLFEIGHFIDSRELNSDLWHNISRRISGDPLLREAVAVVVVLASQFFRVQVPVAVEVWIREIRPAVLIWIENYARICAFGRARIDEFEWFPASKLVLFLHRQYVPDSREWRRIATTLLLGLKGLKRVSHSLTTKRLAEGKPRIRIGVRQFRRTMFHLGSGIRYLWEMPRWWQLTRACPPNESYFKRGCSPAA